MWYLAYVELDNFASITGIQALILTSLILCKDRVVFSALGCTKHDLTVQA